MKGGKSSLAAAWRAALVLVALALLGYASKAKWGAPEGGSGGAPPQQPGPTGPAAPAPPAPPVEFPSPPPVPAPPPPLGPSSPAAPAPPRQEHGLHFQNTAVTVDVAADATQTVVDFPFENRNSKTLTIREVEKDCDCADVVISNGKLSYAPGEGGIIRAKFRLSTLVGQVEKSFKLFLDGDPPEQPTHLLIARINIPVIIQLSAKTVDWRVGGEKTPQKVDIRVTHEQPIRLLGATSSRDGLRATLKTVEDGRHCELWLEPSDLTQPGLALIRMETDSPIPRWKLLQVFARFLRAGDAAPPAPKP